MVPIKNHELFFRAARLLIDASPAPLRFVVVGGGELMPELVQLVDELGLRDHVFFLGWRRDLDHIYADLDAIVLSSRNEGTPVALIEAMAAGVPIVATAVGGVPDLLYHGARGELVGPPFSAADLAAATLRALSPRARERAAAFRAQTLDEYGAERLCRDLEILYTHLLKEKPSRP
jgi:glycosyltransferase involved in cell wall biosynthesis